MTKSHAAVKQIRHKRRLSQACCNALKEKMHTKKHPFGKFAAIIIICVLVLLSACSQTNSDVSSDKIRIITVNFPPADFSRMIGKDLVEVRQLLLPGVESHVFEPTPQDIIEIREADLFIYGGGLSDTWVENLLKDNEISPDNTLIMMDYVTAVTEEIIRGMQHEHDQDHAGEIDDDDNHHRQEKDEHVWTDPKNAIKISEAIQDKLIALDPDNAGEYRTNYNAFAKKLNDLDDKWSSAVADNERDVLIFADRFPFRYLTDAYGLKYYAAFPGCSAETEPNPATIVFLINKVRDESIPYIFTIEMSNQALAKTVAEETGAEILQLHSIHNRTVEEAAEAVSYLELMYKNLENVTKALN